MTPVILSLATRRASGSPPRSPHGRRARLALLCAALALPAAAAAAVCPPKCASVSSVVHAAGVPPGVAQIVDTLSFDGTALKDADAAVKQLAQEIKAWPARATVTLKVGADGSLSGAAARRQATARAGALRAALSKAGVPAKRVKVVAQ
jgi:hypothetical protein